MQDALCVSYRAKKHVKVSRILTYVILSILAIGFLFPYVWLIFSSFKTPEDIFSQRFSILPINEEGHLYFSFENYKNAFEYLDLGKVFLNTIVVCAINTVANLFLNALAGYALARIEFKGKKPLFIIVLAAMMVPGTIMTIPNLIICAKLGILDTLPVLILPFVMSIYNVFLMKQQFVGLSKDLEEAAVMDGAGPMKIFFTIGLPLVSNMLVVLGITTFMWNYNNFMWAVLALPSNSDADTLAKTLGNLVSLGSQDSNVYPIMLAGCVITSLPLIAIFFILQRYILAGISLGGVKKKRKNIYFLHYFWRLV